MTARKVIEVPLPDEAEVTAGDVEQLAATFAAIVGLRYPGSGDEDKAARALTAEGWTVGLRLMWVAEARKGREYECAHGRTKEEAFSQLHQLTQMDDVVSVP